MKFNISNDEIASLEGTMLTVQPNVTRDAEPRVFYVDVTITTPVSQVTVKITAEQKAALNFNPVKAGIVVSVKICTMIMYGNIRRMQQERYFQK